MSKKIYEKRTPMTATCDSRVEKLNEIPGALEQLHSATSESIDLVTRLVTLLDPVCHYVPIEAEVEAESSAVALARNIEVEYGRVRYVNEHIKSIITGLEL